MAQRVAVPATDLKFHSKFSEKCGAYVELTHGKTYFELQGPEDGIPVVFVHGLNISNYCWDDYVERLLETGKFRTLTYDLYVRGYSGVPREVVSPDLCVQQLLELIDFAFGEASKVILCGISQGGAISACFATKHPNRVLKALLFCPAGAGANVPKALAIMQSIPFVGSLIWYMVGQRVLLHRLHVNRFRDLVHRYNEIPPGKIDYIIERVSWLYTEKPDFFWAYYNVLTSWDFFDLHKTWTIPKSVPVKIIWGDKDVICPISGLDLIKSILSHADVKILENCGHGIPLEEPEVSYQELLDYISA